MLLSNGTPGKKNRNSTPLNLHPPLSPLPSREGRIFIRDLKNIPSPLRGEGKGEGAGNRFLTDSRL
jgi:hypothetical protein